MEDLVVRYRGASALRWLCGQGLALALVVGLVLGVPGPVDADSFTDDEGGFYEPALDALAERGILDGTECGEGLICPDQDIERWVIAVWLVRVLDDAEPVEVSSTRFVDVGADEWWMPFVERLAELGVTMGCEVEPARFCPEHFVTRAQMATFLSRAFILGKAEPAGFVDTKGHTHEEDIDAIAAVRFTLGCDVEPLRFCPHAHVTRGQMATFLARALGLVALQQTVGRSVPQLAFMGHEDGRFGVLLVDADGRNLRQLTTRSSRDPAWSPDGERIAYVGGDGYELIVMDADGKNRKRIVERLWIQDPVWSPDGSRIAFANALSGWHLYVVNSDGSNLQRLLKTPGNNPNIVRWSPDGFHIAFNNYLDKGWQVFLADVASGEFWQITQNASSQPHLEWSPDGSRIAFNGGNLVQRNGSTFLQEDAYVVGKNGDNLQLLTTGLASAYPKWSPDGSQVAFTQWDHDDPWALFVGDDAGRNPRRLANTNTGVYGFTWSPDGTKIAFQSVIDGGWEIFLVVLDTAELQRMTHELYRAVSSPGLVA